MFMTVEVDVLKVELKLELKLESRALLLLWLELMPVGLLLRPESSFEGLES